MTMYVKQFPTTHIQFNNLFQKHYCSLELEIIILNSIIIKQPCFQIYMPQLKQLAIHDNECFPEFVIRLYYFFFDYLAKKKLRQSENIHLNSRNDVEWCFSTLQF